MLGLRDNMTEIAEDTIEVYGRPLALRVVRTIKANIVLETRCVIYVDILRGFAPLYLRVTVLLKGQPHSINLTLDQLKGKGVCRQYIWESSHYSKSEKSTTWSTSYSGSCLFLNTTIGSCYTRSYYMYIIYLWP